MRLLSFVSLILVLTVCLMQFYASVRETYNGISELQAQMRMERGRHKAEWTKYALEREQFLEFRQTVATLMPGVLEKNGAGDEGYPLRSLASTITRADSQALRSTVAKTLFEQAKKQFREKDYRRAVQNFRQVIDRFGFSPYVAESYFLMAEAYFLDDEFERCIEVVHQMIELFPSHELTGFSMVRLGRVFEIQNRNEEAIEIYKTVIRSFPQRDVAGQAKSSMRGLTL